MFILTSASDWNSKETTYSIVSGSLPSKPIMIASGVMCPFPVAANEPYNPILSLCTLSRMPKSCRSCVRAPERGQELVENAVTFFFFFFFAQLRTETKIFAARMGPTV